MVRWWRTIAVALLGLGLFGWACSTQIAPSVTVERRFTGTVTSAAGASVPFDMSLFLRKLASGHNAVTGGFMAGQVAGSVNGTLDGTFESGTFSGRLSVDTALASPTLAALAATGTQNDAGRLTVTLNQEADTSCVVEQEYTGLLSVSSLSWTPGSVLHSCPTNPLGFPIEVGTSTQPPTTSVSTTSSIPTTSVSTTTTTSTSSTTTSTTTSVPSTTTTSPTTSTTTSVPPTTSTTSSTTSTTTSVPRTAPTITTQPQSQSIITGMTATLSVTATGTAPLTYQWYVGPSGTTTNPIAGATASSFTTPALTSTTSYWVRVSNAAGSADSGTATITVTQPPMITTQPQSQSIAPGTMATLSVTATGTAPLTYQWYVGPSGTTTNPIAGATASSFTTPALTSTTSYWVRVSNAGGSANSNTATITVAPANLSFSFSPNPVPPDTVLNSGCPGFPTTWTYDLTITNAASAGPFTVSSWTFNFGSPSGQVQAFTVEQFESFFKTSRTIPPGGKAVGRLCVGSTFVPNSVSHTFIGVGGSGTFTTAVLQLLAPPVPVPGVTAPSAGVRSGSAGGGSDQRPPGTRAR
jgi:Ig-like domain CHU_C associated